MVKVESSDKNCPLLVKRFHKFLYPYVTSVNSNLIVSKTQRTFGLDSTSGVSKNAFGILAYIYFRAATSLGDDAYYALPLLYWYCFPISVSFSTAFGLVITAGQFVKDVSCLPRPPAQFEHKGKKYYIAKLENHYNTEYGLPSTHAMSGSLIFIILLKMDKLGLLSDSFNIPLVGTVATLSCALSRLYMGVHSIYDVLFGLLLAFLIQFSILIPYGEAMDMFLYQTNEGIFATALILLWFTTLYPKTSPWSASWGTACQLFGVWVGCAVGLWYCNQVDPQLVAILSDSSLLHKPLQVWHWPTLGYKTAVGLLVTIVTKEVVKLTTSSLLTSLLLNGAIVVPREEKFDTDGRPVPTNKLYAVEVPTRLMSYGVSAFATIAVVPMLWRELGL